MAQISATLVRDLRERTGAGMMDCKQALEATGGDFEGAVDWLRKKGLKSADKKASRETQEGRVFGRVSADGKSGTLVAVACETDFMARTPDFEAFLEHLVEHVAAHKPADAAALMGQVWKATGTSVEEAIKSLIGKLGENIQVAGLWHVANPSGFVGSYIHHNHKVGVMVSVTTQAERATAEDALRNLCMHIAFANPEGLSRDEIPADAAQRERAIYLEEVQGKPENIREKIVAGKLDTWYADRVLEEQKWVHDNSKSVAKALVDLLGPGTKIQAFRRFSIG